jgi:hypothetical protein
MMAGRMKPGPDTSFFSPQSGTRFPEIPDPRDFRLPVSVAL